MQSKASCSFIATPSINTARSSDHLSVGFHTPCMDLDILRESSQLQGLTLNTGAVFNRLLKLITAQICNSVFKNERVDNEIEGLDFTIRSPAGHSDDTAEKAFCNYRHLGIFNRGETAWCHYPVTEIKSKSREPTQSGLCGLLSV